ncbi:MAG: DUF6067 family protein [Candidatus Omnitrophica bacterium]|nr:DUF6067 family protein [Candidatus Omnitrophota bacterium]
MNTMRYYFLLFFFLISIVYSELKINATCGRIELKEIDFPLKIELHIMGENYKPLAALNLYPPTPIKIFSTKQEEKKVEVTGKVGIENNSFVFTGKGENLKEKNYSISYEILPEQDIVMAVWFVVNFDIQKVKTICNETEKIEISQQKEFSNPNILSSKKMIYIETIKGEKIEIKPGSNIASLSLVDGRKWGTGFHIRCYFSQTTSHPSIKINKGEKLSGEILINFISSSEEKNKNAQKENLNISSKEMSYITSYKIPCPYFENSLQVDGKLKENFLENLTKFSNFYKLGTMLPSPIKNEFYIGHNNEGVYIAGIIYLPSNYVPYGNSCIRDSEIWKEDSIEVFIQNPLSKDVYHFIGNIYNSIYDEKNDNSKWDGNWNFYGKLSKDRWELEIFIPFSTVEINPKNNMEIGFQVAMNLQSINSYSSLFHVKNKYVEGVKNCKIIFTQNFSFQIEIKNEENKSILLGKVISLKPIQISGKIINIDKNLSKEIAPFLLTKEKLTLPLELSEGENYLISLFFNNDYFLTIPFFAEFSFDLITEMNYIFFNPENKLWIWKPTLNLTLILKEKNNIEKISYKIFLNGKIVKEEIFKDKILLDFFTKEVDVSNLKEGRYTLSVEIQDKNQRIKKKETNFYVYEKPQWFSMSYNISEDVVPPPWEPLKIINGCIIKCWGREYKLGDFLFSNIVNQEEEMLKSPISIVIKSDKNLHIKKQKKEIVNVSKSKIIVKNELDYELLDIVNFITVEFDGMVKVDMKIIPKGENIKIEKLYFKIPLKKNFAKLISKQGLWGVSAEEYATLLKFEKNKSSLNEKILKNKLEPIWIGNEKGGICWFNESDENFYVENKDEIINIIENEESCELIIKFIDKTTYLQNELNYTYGLQATPVKPFPNDFLDRYGIVQVTEDFWYNTVKTIFEQKEKMDLLASNGVKTLIDQGNWAYFHSSLYKMNEQWLKNFVNECHKRGIKAVIYLSSEITTGTPEWEIMGNVVLKVPKGFPYIRKTTPKHESYVACNKSIHSEYLIYKVKYLLENFKIDGVYLDGVGSFPICMNEKHGCGYRDKNNKLYPTRGIFATRELIKKIYILVKKHNPNGVVDIHGLPIPPILSFATSYIYGEQWMNIKRENIKDIFDILPLHSFRASFMGKNFGIPSNFLLYQKRPWLPDEALSLGLIHDTPVRPWGLYSDEEFDFLKKCFKIWNILKDFNINEATFIGYWENNTFKTTEDDRIKVSYWEHKNKNKFLLVIANFNEEKTVEICSSKIENAEIVNLLTGEKIKSEKNKFSLKIGKNNFCLIKIEK